LPVIGFDTGSLSEIVDGDAGCLVPYGGNPWKLEKPDIPALAKRGRGCFGRPDAFSQFRA
jgi:hypothetical protein